MTPHIAKFVLLSGLAASAAYGQGTAFKDSNLEATIRKFLPDAKLGEPLTDRSRCCTWKGTRLRI
jgi:hypothetical protein